MKLREKLQSSIEELVGEEVFVDTNGETLEIYGLTFSATMRNGVITDLNNEQQTKDKRHLVMGLLEFWDSNEDDIYQFLIQNKKFTAKDAQRITNTHKATLEELIDIIKDAAGHGYDQLLYTSGVDDETVQELRDRGFSVRVDRIYHDYRVYIDW